MRALLALTAIAFAAPAAGTAAVDARAAAPDIAPARAATCAPPSLAYRGAPYRVVQLRRHRLDLGLRLRRPLVRGTAVLTDHAGCTDVVVCTLGQPCAPPPAQPPTVTEVRVLRLAKISPRVALASGNAGVIYVARDLCANRRVGAPLVRCLRRAKPPAPAAPDGPAVDALRAAGLDLRSTAEVDGPFFEPRWRLYGRGLFVVAFGSAEAAAAEAAKVRPDGTTYVGGARLVHVNWVDTPHFFRAGAEIVVYIGSDPSVLGVLRAVLGEQFAGR